MPMESVGNHVSLPVSSSSIQIEPKREFSSSTAFATATFAAGTSNGVPAEHLLCRFNEWTDSQRMHRVFTESTCPVVYQASGQQHEANSGGGSLPVKMEAVDSFVGHVSDDSDESSVDARSASSSNAAKRRARGDGKTWVHLKTFQSKEEALQYVSEGDSWSIRTTKNTLDGAKVFYRCNKVKKKQQQCPAGLYLLYENTSDRVLAFACTSEHSHDEGEDALQSSGLRGETRDVVRQVFNEGCLSEQNNSRYWNADLQRVASKRTKFNDISYPCGGVQAASSSQLSSTSSHAECNSFVNAASSNVLAQILKALQRLERKVDGLQRRVDDVQRVHAQQQATINTLAQQNDRLLGYASTTQQILARDTKIDAADANVHLRAFLDKEWISPSLPRISSRYASATNSSVNGNSHFGSACDIGENSGAGSHQLPALGHVTFEESSNGFQYSPSEDIEAASPVSVPDQETSTVPEYGQAMPSGTVVDCSRRKVKFRPGADLIQDPSNASIGLIGGDPDFKMEAVIYARLLAKHGGSPMRFLVALLCHLYGQERLSGMSYRGNNSLPALIGQPAFNAAVAQTRRQFRGFEMTTRNIATLCDRIGKIRMRLANKANAGVPLPLVVERGRSIWMSTDNV